MEAQITRIDQLHADALAVTEPGSHVELDSLVASTSSLINSIRGTLERLGTDAKKGGPDAEKKVTLVNAQRKKLQEKVQHFQNIEKVYRDKVRDRAIRQYKIGRRSLFSLSDYIVNPDVTEQELSTALSDPNTQIFQQALLTSTRSSQARSTLSEVQSRHNDILAIERKIQELAQLFTELGVMVELQELPIEEVARQTENIKTTTAEGVAQVSRAAKLARAVRRKKWWCLFIILLIIAIIVIIVVVTQVVNKKTS